MLAVWQALVGWLTFLLGEGVPGNASELAIILAELDGLGNLEVKLLAFIDHQTKINSEVSTAVSETPRLSQRLSDHDAEISKFTERVVGLSRMTFECTAVKREKTNSYVVELILADVPSAVIDTRLSK